MRIIVHERTEPYRIKLKDVPGMDKISTDQKVLDYEIHICGCGLSHNKPFCDGSHKITRDEKTGEIFVYNENKERTNAGKYYASDGKL